MLTLIQRHFQTTAYQYVSEHGLSNFTMFTCICITEGVNYSRITLRFSITRIKPPTTDFPPVPDDILKVVRVNARQTDTRRYTYKMHMLECSACGECKVSVWVRNLKRWDMCLTKLRHTSHQPETHVSPSWKGETHVSPSWKGWSGHSNMEIKDTLFWS